jgi:hypothetical protein
VKRKVCMDVEHRGRPFTETKETIAWFAIVRVDTRAEAIEWTRRFLSIAREGVSEIGEMHDAPAYPPEAARQSAQAARQERHA